ncbi:MAG: class I SAM-dependent methyltransferase [Elusimicrobia bacterium]|nr:class I SAM-dependent methyltransferase [Elusimicrobiota bacterium]
MSINPFDRVWRGLQEKNIDYNVKIRSQQYNRKQFLELIYKYVNQINRKRRIKLLEIGCGTAIDSYTMANMQDLECWAIDISEEAIKLAEEVGKNFNNSVNLNVMDAEYTDFTDENFDIIFSQGVIEHFKDPEKIMKEQKRILADDGYLIIDVPQKFNIYTLFRIILTKMGRWPYGWERSYSRNELKRLGRINGLEMIETIGRVDEFELSKSSRIYIKALGHVYNIFMKCFNCIFNRFSSYYLQDITAVFRKKEI